MATRRLKKSILTSDILKAIAKGQEPISKNHLFVYAEMRDQQKAIFHAMDELNHKLVDISKNIRQILIDKSAIGAIKKPTGLLKRRKRLGKG